MLQELIDNMMLDIKNKYPQIETPAAMKAIISSASKSSEKYAIDVTLTERSLGEKKEYMMEMPYYIYSVKVIDNTGNENSKYPVIPNIKSREQFEQGQIVTIVFTGGELIASIVGG